MISLPLSNTCGWNVAFWPLPWVMHSSLHLRPFAGSERYVNIISPYFLSFLWSLFYKNNESNTYIFKVVFNSGCFWSSYNFPPFPWIDCTKFEIGQCLSPKPLAQTPYTFHILWGEYPRIFFTKNKLVREKLSTYD